MVQQTPESDPSYHFIVVLTHSTPLCVCCAGLQQQLHAVQAGREGCEQQLAQQLQQLQALNAAQKGDLVQAQQHKALLQGEVGALGQHLMEREQELRQAQVGGCGWSGGVWCWGV